jgi:hypothetical protein
MKLKYLGKDYNFDMDELDVKQASVIKANTGLSLRGLEEGISDGDPDALRAMFWVMLVNNDEPNADINTVNFKIVPFARAIQEASEAEAEAAAEVAKKDDSPNVGGRRPKATTTTE